MIEKRNIAMCIVLSVITCGIYGIYWFIVVTDDVNSISKEEGTSGGLSFLFNLITCGVYGIFWGYKTGEKLDQKREENGECRGSFNVLLMILCIFGFTLIGVAIAQSELNKNTEVKKDEAW